MSEKQMQKLIKQCLSNDNHKYILCDTTQSPTNGKILTTKYDMDSCESLDDFLNILAKNGEISNEEKENIVVAYYCNDDILTKH